MYDSLKKHCPSFTLYVFAFDDVSFRVLNELALDSVVCIGLKQFEDEELLKIKGTRTRGEYCWTATPSTIRFVLDHYSVSHCTYLDADLYFYSDPSKLIHDLPPASVSIISHRYTQRYDQSATSGIYCVQFMTFVNDNNGRMVLNWWRNACLEWCYNRFEDGKFGDQKYLDDWLTRFSGSVKEISDEGAGLAPWNLQQYELQGLGNAIYIHNLLTRKKDQLIFTHFHQLKFLKPDKVDLCRYLLNNKAIDLLYKPYVRHVKEISDRLKKVYPKHDFNGTQHQRGFKTLLVGIKRRLLREYHIFELEKFLA